MNNNTFVLWMIINEVHFEHRFLYVYFINISNVFPSTNRNGLWMKLKKLGATGNLFDWLLMLYT